MTRLKCEWEDDNGKTRKRVFNLDKNNDLQDFIDLTFKEPAMTRLKDNRLNLQGKKYFKIKGQLIHGSNEMIIDFNEEDTPVAKREVDTVPQLVGKRVMAIIVELPEEDDQQ